MVRLSCGFHGLRNSFFRLILCVAVVCVSFGTLPASANVTGCTLSNNCDEGQAFALASQAAAYCASLQPPQWQPDVLGPTPHNAAYAYYSATTTDGAGRSFCAQLPQNRFYFLRANTCDTRTPLTGLFQDDDPNTSDAVCDDGCLLSPVLIIQPDASFVTEWQPTGNTCTEADAAPPIPDTDGDGVPDDDDAFPNDPTESTDSDGDGQGDNSDFAPDDATNGDDDGNGNESDNSASGGGTCAAPPACAGDGIACATLYQQWQTRCAIERLSEELASGNGGTGQEPGDDDETTDWGAGDGSKPSWQEVNVNSTMFDTSGFMGGGSCPTWGPVEILGVSYPLPQVHCSILSWIGYLVVAVAFVIAARIIAG